MKKVMSLVFAAAMIVSLNANAAMDPSLTKAAKENVAQIDILEEIVDLAKRINAADKKIADEATCLNNLNPESCEAKIYGQGPDLVKAAKTALEAALNVITSGTEEDTRKAVQQNLNGL